MTKETTLQRYKREADEYRQLAQQTRKRGPLFEAAALHYQEAADRMDNAVRSYRIGLVAAIVSAVFLLLTIAILIAGALT